MKALVAALGLAMAAATASWLSPAPPPSCLARQLVVGWNGGREIRRVSATGQHRFAFPCSHVPGQAAPLMMQVTRRLVPGQPPEEPCQECTPAEVAALARAGGRQSVAFCDALRQDGPPLPGDGASVSLPNGKRMTVGHAFGTAGGLTCVVATGDETLIQVARAALPGDQLRIHGRVAGLLRGQPCVVVSDLVFGTEDPPKDEPPWDVTVHWGDRPVRRISRSGDYVLRLPCAHKQGAFEQVWLRLRESQIVRCEAGGHRIYAELAATPAARSYGLQGRSGLELDHGMLFWFPRPLRPTFVMKTVSFPLSIAFIRQDGVIANIVDLNPADPRQAVAAAPITYVLEMPRGWFREHGIGPGDTVAIP